MIFFQDILRLNQRFKRTYKTMLMYGLKYRKKAESNNHKVAKTDIGK